MVITDRYRADDLVILRATGGAMFISDSAEFLQRLPDQPSQLAHHAPAEGEHADHEDHALHHGHPGADLGEVVLHRDDDEGAHHRPEHGSQPPEHHHQHHFSRHGPVHV